VLPDTVAEFVVLPRSAKALNVIVFVEGRNSLRTELATEPIGFLSEADIESSAGGRERCGHSAGLAANDQEVATPRRTAALAAMGAAVTPMAWSEVYSALQLGVVDGMANTPDLIYNAKLGEVQKYLALTGHLAQIQTVVINDKLYQSLSPELRAVLEKAAIDAGDYQNNLALIGNAEYLEELHKLGMTITSVEVSEFAEHTKNAWKPFEAQFGKGMYEKIVAAQH
jgi:hypothetical protein